eukprot:TRINITY_DN6483_c0_g1_i1.p2 TRINITY_DN6483_c0_g1~~TRINITY_DN6483_c0_g1_i1.p2  ORF type:complete len:83 (+),score=14.63 TRINITY_DN6483_c0_g1_i1:82-330(+)
MRSSFLLLIQFIFLNKNTMSRIGKLPVVISDNIDVTIDAREVKVKGPKGELTFTHSDVVEVIKKKKYRLRGRSSETAKAHRG